MTESKLPATQQTPQLPAAVEFDFRQREAKMYAASKLIPVAFQNNIADCAIAIEMADRIGASRTAVMQNIHVIHGRPSFSSSFIIAAINKCGMFEPLRFRVAGEGDQKSCVAWTKDRATGDVLEGPPVTIEMAKKEGWYSKNGSKWQTMPELMLRYRAAAFFGRLYVPEILMGMQTLEEAQDIASAEPKDITPAAAQTATDSINEKIAEAKKRGRKPAEPKAEPVIIEAEASPAAAGDEPKVVVESVVIDQPAPPPESGEFF